MAEGELIKKILSGEVNLFEKIVDKYERRIFAYLLRLLNFHQQDAEDITSQTFIKAYINLASYNTKLSFSAWIYRIAHNEAVNLIHKKSKSFVDNIDNITIGAEFDFDKPNKNDLEKILNSLKADDKNILILFYLEEKTIKEISDILKITEGSVKTRLSRAREKAKKYIK